MIGTAALTFAQNFVAGDATFFIDADEFPYFCDFSVSNGVLGMFCLFTHIRKYKYCMFV